MLEKPIVAFGEVLWDIFPDVKMLGGAPLNFAYYFKKAGGNPEIVSAVGDDSLGKETIDKIINLGLSVHHIQKNNRPTGKVNVSFDLGKPKFSIERFVAWEQINYPPKNLVIDSYGIYLGTVSRISFNNRCVLDRLLDDFKKKIVFLDLNLREGFCDVVDIGRLLQRANYLNLNEEEAVYLKENAVARGKSLEKIVESLITSYDLEACCISLGSRGAVGGNKNGIFRIKGIPAKAGGDSVGCGDAFAATWLAYLLKGKTMEEALYGANRVGSLVASQRGAIVDINL